MGNPHLKRSLAFCLMALFCAFGSQAELLRWDDGAIVTGHVTDPKRTIEKVGNDIIVTYEFGDYGVTPTSDDSGYILSMPQFTSCSTPGLPSYLLKKDLLNVPEPQGISVEITEAEYKDFRLRLAPAQPIRLMTEPEPPVTSPITQYAGLLPENPLSDIQAIPFKGNGVVEVVVTPALYSMETETVRIYKKLSYRVVTTDTDHALYSLDEEDTSPSNELPAEFDINQIPILPGTRPVYAYNTTSTLLIISVPEYEETLKPFIEWKRTLGIPVKTLYNNDWTFLKILQKIRKAYDSDPSIGSLLFVGNHATVPGMQRIENITKYNGDKLYSYSDLGYTLITQNLIPEVTRGRLPVENVEQLKIVLDKIMEYEQNPIQDPQIYKTGVVMSYIDTNNLDPNSTKSASKTADESGFLACTEEIANYLSDKGNMSIERLYSYRHPVGYFTGITKWGKNYGYLPIPEDLNYDQPFWNHGNADFVNEINSGACIGLYLGHGNWDCFYNGSWTNQGQFDFDKVNQLNNSKKEPFLIAYTCLTGNYTVDNLANRLLTRKDGGCVGYFGASSEIGIDEALCMSIKTVHSIWNKGKFDTNIIPNFRPEKIDTILRIVPLRAGEILNLTVQDRLRTSQGTKNKAAKSIHFFGDPTSYLRIESPSRPKNITLTYDNHTLVVESGSGPYNIAFYDSASGISECWYGIKASFSTLKPASVKVCVYGPNAVPFITHFGAVDIPVDEAEEQSEMGWTCTAKPGSILSLGFTNSVNSQVVVTNIATQAQTWVEVSKGETNMDIPLTSPGNYGVTLIVNGKTLSTNKIQIYQ